MNRSQWSSDQSLSKRQERHRWRRHFFSWLLVTFFLMTAPSVDAQQPKKVPRIGYLAAPDATTEAARVDGFRQALRELGYIDGQTIAIEYRYTQRGSSNFSLTRLRARPVNG